MAGFLPNVPGVRIPYHRDGSLVKYVTTNGSTAWNLTGSWTTVASGNVNEMNDGDTSGVLLYSVGNGASGTGAIYVIVFPQTVTLTGHNLIRSGAYGPGGGIYWSADTIDGTDGTWNLEVINWDTLTTAAAYRSITPVNIPNVKAVRIGGYDVSGNASSTTILDAAFYGQWAPQTLAAWHPTLDQQINGHELDFGDVLLGNVYNKQFRIKNGRALTANNVVISCTTGTTEFISGLTLSLDGTTFTGSVTVPSIAPGGISGTVYVRRTVSAGQSANILAMAPIDFIATTWT